MRACKEIAKALKLFEPDSPLKIKVRETEFDIVHFWSSAGGTTVYADAETAGRSRESMTVAEALKQIVANAANGAELILNVGRNVLRADAIEEVSGGKAYLIARVPKKGDTVVLDCSDDYYRSVFAGTVKRAEEFGTEKGTLTLEDVYASSEEGELEGWMNREELTIGGKFGGFSLRKIMSADEAGAAKRIKSICDLLIAELPDTKEDKLIRIAKKIIASE